jgi:hypothetical protein
MRIKRFNDLLYENLNYDITIPDNVNIFANKNRNELFVYMTVDGVAIGGQYSGFANTGEKIYSSMKIGIDDKYRGNGYGELLYLSTLSLVGNIGLSPHRKKDSTRPAAINVWEKLEKKPYIKRVDLDLKLYDDNKLLDSKYILIDENIKKMFLNKIKIYNIDVFDETNENSKKSWEIVNIHMSH